MAALPRLALNRSRDLAGNQFGVEIGRPPHVDLRTHEERACRQGFVIFAGDIVAIQVHGQMEGTDREMHHQLERRRAALPGIQHDRRRAEPLRSEVSKTMFRLSSSTPMTTAIFSLRRVAENSTSTHALSPGVKCTRSPSAPRSRTALITTSASFGPSSLLRSRAR